jgi:hypothetical protein
VTASAEVRIQAELAAAATGFDAALESLVVTGEVHSRSRHERGLELTQREALADAHGSIHLGLVFLGRGEVPPVFTAHPCAVEQDCYDDTVAALGFDPLASDAVGRAA